MRIALAQVNCELGDVEANLKTARDQVAEAAAQQAELVVFPELTLHGYDLGALPENRAIPLADERIAELSTHGVDVVIGFHEHARLRSFNTSAYFRDGELVYAHRKLYLPNYLRWEEKKHVSPGQSMRAFDTPGGRSAILVCNDAWQAVLPWLAVQDGAELLIVPTNSASSLDPEALDTISYWDELLRFTARTQQCWVIFVNRVGDESGAVFWGGSRVVDPRGNVIAQAPKWEPALLTVELDVREADRLRRSVPLVAEARLGVIGREINRLIEEGGDS